MMLDAHRVKSGETTIMACSLHFGAFTSQLLCGDFANATGRASDEGDLII